MRGSWVRAVSAGKSRRAVNGLVSRNATLQCFMHKPISTFLGNGERTFLSATSEVKLKRGGSALCGIGATPFRFVNGAPPSGLCYFLSRNAANLCSMPEHEVESESLGSVVSPPLGDSSEVEELPVAVDCRDRDEPKPKAKVITRESIDFTKIPIEKLPTVIIIGRPNVGKSALFNRLIRRREALVYNTPNDHVTRDIRDGVAKLGDLRFRVLDSAGLEAEASAGSVLGRTAAMTGYVLAKAHCALFLIDARDGIQPMDLDVGKWLRKHAPDMKTIVIMNKAELLDNITGSLGAAAGEAYTLGFGDPIALSAETGFGLAELCEILRPTLEDYVLQYINVPDEEACGDSSYTDENIDSKLPLQLAIVGKPNVGKSTLLNALLQENRVLVGPEAGLTRDSIRVEFQYEGRNIYLVDTAGWMERTKQDKGASSLSIVQSRKNLMRAHVVALVLDAEEMHDYNPMGEDISLALKIIEDNQIFSCIFVDAMFISQGQILKAKRSMKHAEVVIARRTVEEGRSLVVVVNKMDLLKGNQYDKILNAVPEEIQSVIPQVTGIPVVFVSALEGIGRTAMMQEVVDTYERWCCRLPTARLNRWLRKVMSRHSWKDQSAKPKIKYFTQVKARPPTFVAFVSGKVQLSDSELRFLTKSLKEDFDLGGIPLRVMQRSVPRRGDGKSVPIKNTRGAEKMTERMRSDKRGVVASENAADA